MAQRHTRQPPVAALVAAAAFLSAACALSVAGDSRPELALGGEPEAELASPGADAGGDAYLAEVQADCATTGASWPCAKAKLLRFAVRAASSPRQVFLWGPLSLSPLVSAGSPVLSSQAPLFPGSAPRAGDSEADKVSKFALRMLERYARSHALRLDLAPRDDTDRQLATSEARGKKKKAAIVLPLILFMKLKALLIPTLLGVLFIKKLLVLAAVFLPALLHYLKACKMPYHHHHAVAYHVPHGDWSSSGADHSATGVDGPTGYGGSGGHYASRKHLAGGRRSALRRQRY
ncbi:uncharacterized protein LOC124788528 [Schistocerca piceifrons]|uniref:uncharacterized protein LOC124788528 n=1 Tax=Schistocerca piceifrons TaxID=274613 RepID=UPI001F5FD5FB|nr:uncharacterized protein LOC124788528 [Schistocerca piceifrons]